jgi:hypothetical protein
MVQRIKTGMIADDAVTAAKLNPDAENISVFRNRIINGAMVIDQRNVGASVAGANQTYAVDRWQGQTNIGGKFTMQRNAGSVTPPVGFTNYLGLTSSSAYTLGAGEYCGVLQGIEGFNVADLGWGTASAKTVTLSFQAYSSLTGTFGGSLFNNDGTRSYPFTYTISVANTWTTISITVTGDTSGAWQKTNSSGIYVNFSMGSGSTFSGTAGSWSGSFFRSATGAVSVVGTSGATLYITGVQLEVGTQATSFEYRQYGTELALCQRYFQKSYPQATLPGASVGNSALQNSWGTAGSGICGNAVVLPVTMRADPTLVVYDVVGNSARVSIYDTGASETNNIPLNTSNADTQRLMVRIFGYSAAGMAFMYTVSAEI